MLTTAAVTRTSRTYLTGLICTQGGNAKSGAACRGRGRSVRFHTGHLGRNRLKSGDGKGVQEKKVSRREII